MLLSSRLKSHLNQLAARHLLRQRDIIDKENPLINFSSNDYLNLTTHPEVKKAYQQGIEKYGLGSGASALLAGYTNAHRELEERFADFLGRDKAILFNSGYHANLGVLTTFANRHCTVIADKYCHASLIDGITLARAKHKRYQHHDYQQAAALSQQHHSDESLLITESVFSMQGDITDVKKLADIAQQTNSMLIVDDAHAIGVLGKQGGGICDYANLSQQDVPCLITPLGKAMGSAGAIVSGSSDMIDALIQCARTYRYTTALPPAVSSATLAALAILTKEPERRNELQQRIQFFIRSAKAGNLPLASYDETPIKSIPIGTSEAALMIQTKLAALGYLVSCIRPPSVPANQACLRVSLSCSHTEAQISQLINLLTEYHESSSANSKNI